MHKVAAETIAARMAEVRVASATGGGTALTTTLGLISIPIGSTWLSVTGRNYVGADVVQFTINPWLTIVKTNNALATGSISSGDTEDISDEAQDGDAVAISFASLDVAANNDFIYIGSELPFGGVAVDMAAAVNGTGSVLTVNYWNGGWTDISDTDGTISGGATFAQDGNVTWTVPSTWEKDSLLNIGDTTVREAWSMVPLYWTRWEVSVQLDATVDVDQFRSLNRSTNYAELLEGQAFEQAIQVGGPGGIACVEARTDTGTADLIVNVAAGRGEEFA